MSEQKGNGGVPQAVENLRTVANLKDRFLWAEQAFIARICGIFAKHEHKLDAKKDPIDFRFAEIKACLQTHKFDVTAPFVEKDGAPKFAQGAVFADGEKTKNMLAQEATADIAALLFDDIVSFELISLPVLLDSGHTLDVKTVASLVAGERPNPMTQGPLRTVKAAATNAALAEIISLFKGFLARVAGIKSGEEQLGTKDLDLPEWLQEILESPKAKSYYDVDVRKVEDAQAVAIKRNPEPAAKKLLLELGGKLPPGVQLGSEPKRKLRVDEDEQDRAEVAEGKERDLHGDSPVVSPNASPLLAPRRLGQRASSDRSLLAASVRRHGEPDDSDEEDLAAERHRARKQRREAREGHRAARVGIEFVDEGAEQGDSKHRLPAADDGAVVEGPENPGPFKRGPRTNKPRSTAGRNFFLFMVFASGGALGVFGLAGLVEGIYKPFMAFVIANGTGGAVLAWTMAVVGAILVIAALLMLISFCCCGDRRKGLVPLPGGVGDPTPPPPASMGPEMGPMLVLMAARKENAGHYPKLLKMAAQVQAPARELRGENSVERSRTLFIAAIAAWLYRVVWAAALHALRNIMSRGRRGVERAGERDRERETAEGQLELVQEGEMQMLAHASSRAVTVPVRAHARAHAHAVSSSALLGPAHAGSSDYFADLESSSLALDPLQPRSSAAASFAAPLSGGYGHSHTQGRAIQRQLSAQPVAEADTDIGFVDLYDSGEGEEQAVEMDV